MKMMNNELETEMRRAFGNKLHLELELEVVFSYMNVEKTEWTGEIKYTR